MFWSNDAESPLAQLVERETVNLEAVGSIPTWRGFLSFLPDTYLLRMKHMNHIPCETKCAFSVT